MKTAAGTSTIGTELQERLLARRLVPRGLGVVEALRPFVVHVAHELAHGAQAHVALVGLEQGQCLPGRAGEPRVDRIDREDHGHAIVDARDPKVYSGESERSGIMAGHIEGAANHFYNNLVDDKGKLKPVPELQKLFTEAGIKPGDRVVTYCFIGQTASVVYMAGRMLGYQMKLYDGSMQEWSRIPSLPMEKTEAPK